MEERTNKRRQRRLGRIMVDYSKPFPCGECGQMVMANEKHDYEDCLEWKRKLESKRFNDKIKARRDAILGNGETNE